MNDEFEKEVLKRLNSICQNQYSIKAKTESNSDDLWILFVLLVIILIVC